MAVFNMVPLTTEVIDEMNMGLHALGPSGQDVISNGECKDLSDYLDIGEGSIRAWFGVKDSKGRTPAYRRAVPSSKWPRGVRDLRIGRMYQRDYFDPLERVKIEQLRFRCFLGSTAGVSTGLERDPVYDGKISMFKPPWAYTLSTTIDQIESIINGTFGPNGLFLRKAWIRMTVAWVDGPDRVDTIGNSRKNGYWQLTVKLREPNRLTGPAGELPIEDLLVTKGGEDDNYNTSGEE